MQLISAEALRQLIGAAFARHGLSARHLAHVVDGLVEASLRGIDTHGVRLTRTYLEELHYGRALAQPILTEHSTFAAAVALDAGHALGLVAASEGADIAIRQAKLAGIGAVAIANSNHFGAAALYPLRIARAGMIGLCFSNADALVAPWNGVSRMLGTNPLSFAAPGTGDDIYCLDMATSQVAYSKVKHAIRSGAQLDKSWCVDGGGEGDVVLQPLGGYKGQGLALMVQILSALLTGMVFDHKMSHLFDSVSPEPRQVGHFILAINIDAFIDRAAFSERLQELLADIRASDCAPDGQIRVAGDRAKEIFQQRSTHGVPVTDDEYAYFAGLAAQLGLAAPERALQAA